MSNPYHDPKNGRFTTGPAGKLTVGKFPHHKDYIFHGTDDKSARLIKKAGLRPGSYLTTDPHIALTEADYTISGDPFGDGKPGTGGKATILAIKRRAVSAHRVTIDKQYEDGNSRAVVFHGRISPKAIAKSFVLKGDGTAIKKILPLLKRMKNMAR